MLSIVMPYYKKDIEFSYIFNNFNLPQLNMEKSTELIIVMDDPSGKNFLLNFLNKLQVENKINFSIRVLVSKETHSWRPPCIAINSGVNVATKNKILVISPETIIFPGSLKLLLNACNEKTFSLGLTKHVSIDAIKCANIETLFSIHSGSNYVPYGAIVFTKDQFDCIGGYDENWKVWGGDDDDFRQRMKNAGFSRKISLAKFMHVNFMRENINGAQEKFKQLEPEVLASKIDSIKRNKNIRLETNKQVGSLVEIKI